MDEVKRNLEKLDGRFKDKLEPAATAGALLVRDDAVIKAPYKTGNLKRSIHTETIEKSDTRVVVMVGTDVEYAAPQEFGTSTGVPAHPYLRPSLDENKEKVPKEIKEALAEALRAAW